MQRLQGQRHDDGRAVGVGDHTVVPFDVVGVNLGDDQRNILVHAERAGVVHHDGTCGHDGLAHLLGNAGACREQRDVDALERLGRHFLHDQIASWDLAAAAEGDGLAGRPGARQGAHLCSREIEIVQDVHEFLAHGARRTCHGHNRIGRNCFIPSHMVLLAFLVI